MQCEYETLHLVSIAAALDLEVDELAIDEEFWELNREPEILGRHFADSASTCVCVPFVWVRCSIL